MKDVFPFYSIGHFINQPNNTTTFEWLSFDQMEEPAVDDYHKHTFYEILWTEAGESKQTIDFKEYEVNPNTLFFISPNQVHHFEEWKPLLGGTILFTEDFYLLNQRNKNNLLELSFLDSFYANPCVVFDAKDFEKILHIIRQIGIEQQRPDRNLLIIQSYLHILLAEIQRHLDNTNDMDSTRKNIWCNLSSSSYARTAFFSP